MAAKLIFSFESYREFLRDYLADAPRGTMARLAQAMTIKQAYLSKVMSGAADLSPEQAVACGNYLGLKAQAGDFFVALVSLERAGTLALKNYWRRQVANLRKEYSKLEKRHGLDVAIDAAATAEYYRSWKYPTVHIATSVPTMQTIPAIAKALSLTHFEVQKILEFLLRARLVEKKGNTYQLRKGDVHLDTASPAAQQALTGWRLRAMENLSAHKKEDIHYSQVIALSHSDLNLLRERLMDWIGEIHRLVKPSPEEALAFYNFDLVQLSSADLER